MRQCVCARALARCRRSPDAARPRAGRLPRRPSRARLRAERNTRSERGSKLQGMGEAAYRPGHGGRPGPQRKLKAKTREAFKAASPVQARGSRDAEHCSVDRQRAPRTRRAGRKTRPSRTAPAGRVLLPARSEPACPHVKRAQRAAQPARPCRVGRRRGTRRQS